MVDETRVGYGSPLGTETVDCRAEDELVQAFALARAGRRDEALAAARSVLQRSPGHSGALELIDELDQPSDDADVAGFPVVDEDTFVRVEPLGAGGFGETSLARDASGRVVVLKELYENWRGRFAARFLNEALTLTRLDHPAIVKVLRLGRWRTSQRLFYAMERVDGRPLTELLDATRVAAQVGNVAIVHRVAEALDHAHARGIVHRDVKPANIVVRDIDGAAAVLVDWGLAGKVGIEGSGMTGRSIAASDVASDGRGELTHGGAGTVGYASPEQLRGDAPTGAMDVYATGAMLYEVLSGHRPLADQFAHLDLRGYAAALRTSTLTELAGRIDPRLAACGALAMRCLRPDPAERPNAQELAAALASVAERCICVRCGTLELRRDSTRVADGWACTWCSLGAPRRAGVAPQTPSPPGVDVAIPHRELGEVLVRGDVVEIADGVRSTRARDELGRDVLLHELLDDATADQGAAFDRAARVATAVDTPSLPRALHSGAGAFTHTTITGTPLAALAPADLAAARADLLASARKLLAAVRRVHELGAGCGVARDRVVVTDATRDLAFPSLRSLATIEGSGADVRAMLDVVDAVLAGRGERYTTLANDVASVRDSELPPDAALARLDRALAQAAQLAACASCNERYPIDDLPMFATGPRCPACARSSTAGPNGYLDLLLTPAQQEARVAAAPRAIWGSVAIGIGCAAAIPLIPRAAGYLLSVIIGVTVHVVFTIRDRRRLRHRIEFRRSGSPPPPAWSETSIAIDAGEALRLHQRHRTFRTAITLALLVPVFAAAIVFPMVKTASDDAPPSSLHPPSNGTTLSAKADVSPRLVTDLLSRVYRAHGGWTALHGFSRMRIQAHAGDRRVDALVSTSRARIHVEPSVDAGYANGSAWVGSAVVAAPDESARARFELWHDPDFVLLRLMDGRYPTIDGGDVTIDGKPCARIDITDVAGGNVSLMIDLTTGCGSHPARRDGCFDAGLPNGMMLAST